MSGSRTDQEGRLCGDAEGVLVGLGALFTRLVGGVEEQVKLANLR
jgi:hypothetical protein